MWTICRAALPLATLLVVPLTASAQVNGTSDITVAAPRDKAALARWTTWVGKAITDNLEYPRVLGPSNAPSGIVDVAFNCSDSGQPSKVKVTHSSGSSRLDDAALRAIQRVKTLHPLPEGIGHDQVYKARLAFLVGDGFDARRRLARMTREADSANDKLWERMGRQATADNAILISAAALS